MKTLTITLALIILALTVTDAQRRVNVQLLETTPTISIAEEQVDHNGRVEPALVATVFGDHEDYEKAWKSYFSEKYNVEFKKNGDYYENLATSVLDWMPTTIGIATKVVKDGEAAKVYLLVYDGSRQINQMDNPDVIEKIKSTMRVQLNDYYVKCYDHSIADSQKEYDKATKSHEKLLSTGTKLAGNILKNESSASKLTNVVSDNESKIKIADAKIDEYNGSIKSQQDKLDEQNVSKTAKATEIKMKQEQLNTYTTSGQLDTKDAQRVTKDLEKLRKEQSKVETESIKSSQQMTKIEEKATKESSNKQKLSSKLSDLKNSLDRNKSEHQKLKNELEINEKAAKDALEKVNSTKESLNKLKDSKMKLGL